MKITLHGDLMFAQTDYAIVHAFDAESGRLLWSAAARGANGLRTRGRRQFFRGVRDQCQLLPRSRQENRPADLAAQPGHDSDQLARLRRRCGDGRDDQRADRDFAGQEDQRRQRQLNDPGHTGRGLELDTGGPILTRPLPAEPVYDLTVRRMAQAYVVESVDGNPLYRVATGGPIGEGFGTFGTRLLLIPSGDNNLYAVDMLDRQGPVDISFRCPDRAGTARRRSGRLHDQHSGQHEPDRPQHRRDQAGRKPTQGGRLAAISATKLYLRSYNLDLFIMDRQTGRMLVDPGETFLRAGLKLRDYDLDIVNRFNDRLYFATSSGMVVCMRETGQPNRVRSRTPRHCRSATCRRKGSSRRLRLPRRRARRPAEGRRGGCRQPTRPRLPTTRPKSQPTPPSNPVDDTTPSR